MITNIVDNRKNRYAWKRIWGVIEPTWNDGNIPGAELPDPGDWSDSIRSRPGMIAMRGPDCMTDLIRWADATWPEVHTTLHLYESNPMAIADQGGSLSMEEAGVRTTSSSLNIHEA